MFLLNLPPPPEIPPVSEEVVRETGRWLLLCVQYVIVAVFLVSAVLFARLLWNCKEKGIRKEHLMHPDAKGTRPTHSTKR
jgi:hypothetical protein